MSNQTASRSLLSWWVCGLLLCASSINYMDRVTLSLVSKRITTEFDLNDAQYGYIEMGFGLAFALGSVIFGSIADRTNIRWLYPAVLFAWSLMAFMTGFVETFTGMLVCRILLGFFEAGHWPCALKTTHRLLPAHNRALGNSVLQSGAAIGAMVTPLIMRQMVTEAPGSWRYAFQVISGVGVIWILFWLLSTNSSDLAPEPETSVERADSVADENSLFFVITSRKFLILAVMVICINMCWHVFRVWMPKFMLTVPGYDESAMFSFMFVYNAMTDVGCYAAGISTRVLHHFRFSTHASRSTVFGMCALMVTAGLLIPWVPAGAPLITVLMMVAFGSLGLFPCYYSFSQELSTRHQGKVLGLLGLIAWVTSAPVHPLLGGWADQTKSYSQCLAITCLFPLLAFVVLLIWWPGTTPRAKDDPAQALV